MDDTRMSRARIAYVFPGQGSQHKGMGAGLFDEFPDLVEQADRVLGYSVRELCTTDPHDRLRLTEFTQPALFVVNTMSYRHHLAAGGRPPDFLAGHSLGEYNALLAAGVFDFATGLRLVQERGRLTGAVTGGAMLAVLGLTERDVRTVLEREGMSEVYIANLNAARQVVLSGRRDDVVRAQQALNRSGARACVLLKVNGAFHSPLMAGVQREFRAVVDRVRLVAPRLPVIANISAEPYPDDVADALTAHLCRPVRWNESVRYLLAHEADQIEQIGPGTVLTRLVSEIKRDAWVSARPAAGDAAPTGRDVALGSPEFTADHGTSWAYVAGSMYHGIASEALVERMARAGFLSFFGSGGLPPARIAEALGHLARRVPDRPYGCNLLHTPGEPRREEELVDVFAQHGMRRVEASAFTGVTPALVRYRVSGLRRDRQGRVVAPNRLMAKVSHPQVAAGFLAPPPRHMVAELLSAGRIDAATAELAAHVAMADDVTVEADSGGHTDGGSPYALLPAILRLRDRLCGEHGYHRRVRVGAAGGIGTPEAVAASLLLGADYVVTGSVNQCTVEAGTSDVVKDMLQDIGVHDTAYAPAGDMFEVGAKIQVLKRGVFFPARANRLQEIYRCFDSLDRIDAPTRRHLEERIFRRSFDEVFELVKEYKPAAEVAKAEQHPRHRMLLVFTWYFAHTSRLAITGEKDGQVDFQVHCGPALGSFNEWVRGTSLADWRNRHVDVLATELMTGAEKFLIDRRYSAG